ncbi:T9SS type A sorting domain-containing protein [Flammeovirga pectinis]|uniref:T9SS type A sorting domain-containing protein n=1 Tax=Flammeovirga pectinis TaxID=2494373 RepID=A0A3Q9FPQ1_9BACT|nr:Ig-like domain-containing protein [Flammeovirga pectinis]AZQ65050.1 T9SS type A sorting domain-containing protein [Flammeovirga pectinis]
MMKRLVLLTFLILNSLQLTAQNTYYVDIENGADANNGLTKETAWKTITKVKSFRTKYVPGDSILFHTDQVWEGQLVLNNFVGTKENPITFSSYGTGVKPHIKGNGEGTMAVHLMNCAYITFDGFEVTNRGESPLGGRYGIEIRANNKGEIYGTQVKNCDIHDINGEQDKNDGQGGGILVKNTGSTTRSRVVDVLIEGNHIYDVVRNGIYGNYNFGLDTPFRNKNVLIRKNLIERIPGDAIVAFGMENAIVEYNICRDFSPLLDLENNAAAGIWAFNSVNTIIQHNQVSGHQAKHDGQGYDADFNCENTIIQYNYSFDNVGGFVLICNDGSKETAKNIKPIVRYNLSINDGFRTDGKKYANKVPAIHIAGPVTEAQIYNNTIYAPKKPASVDKEFVKSNSWFGFADKTTFYNNTFYGVESMAFNMTSSTNNVFSNNAYYGTTNALDSNPMIGTVEGNHYAALVSKRTNGFNVENAGGMDFFGNTAKPTDVGFFSGDEEEHLSLSQRLVQNKLVASINTTVNNGTLKVVNLLDSLMEEQSHAVINGNIEIDASSYPQGVYSVILEGNGILISQKFIKVKDLGFEEDEEEEKNEVTLSVGETKKLTKEGAITWSSDNTSVVTVDETGLINAIGGGKATVTALNHLNEIIATIEVTSISYGNVGAPSNVTVKALDTSATISFTEGSNATFHKIAFRKQGQDWVEIDSIYNDNKEEYVLIGLDVLSTYEVKVSAVNFTNTSGWTSIVTFVTQINVTGITLNKSELSIYVGEDDQLEGTILPNNATVKDIKWTSDDSSVASVDESGVVTAIKSGVTNVNATTVDGDFIATVTITSVLNTVDDAPITSIGENDEVLQNIVVYPNPTSQSYFNIDFNKISSGTIEMYNTIGLVVKEIKVYNQTVVKLEIKDLNAGVYFIVISVGGKMITKKLIVE